ncbi:MAG: DNA repair exonuclease [Planctomycetota bacterium]
MAEAFKFVHASDFHLDQPIRGLAELPVHLKSVLANAPYESARRVFDLAIAERVDFVILSGDLFDISSSGSRPVAFLLSQFERLAEKGIEVYWCSGSVDSIDRWPASIEMPENVKTFSTSVLEDITHRRDGVSVANIYGLAFDANRNSASEFMTDSEDVFSIAVAHGEFDTNTMPFDEIRYWALGGRHKSSKLEKPGSIVSYPGTTQGRTPRETGSFGCNMCRVDVNGKLRIHSIETDSVRWLPQKISIHESVGDTDLKNVLSERALKIITDLGEKTALIHWNLSPSGDFNPKLRHRDYVAQLLDWLRDEFGRGEHGIWSTDLTIDPPSNIPTSWYEEDTILGEYLRAIGRYQSDDSLNLSLHEFVPAGAETDGLGNIARVSDERRDMTLRNTALVGIEYLGVEKELPELVAD